MGYLSEQYQFIIRYYPVWLVLITMPLYEIINRDVPVQRNCPRSHQSLFACYFFLPLHFPRQLHEMREPFFVFHNVLFKIVQLKKLFCKRKREKRKPSSAGLCWKRQKGTRNK